MGILSGLAKIGGFALAPFTGGASIPIGQAIGTGLDAMGSAGSVMGAQQGGANNARVAQGQLDLGQNRNLIDLYQAQQQAQQQQALTDLQRQQFGQQNRSATAKQALIGALLGGGGTGIGSSWADALQKNPDALAAMKTLGSQGATAQATPLTFQGGQTIAAPTLTKMPTIDTGGGVMGTLAKIMQLGGSVSPYIHRYGAADNPYIVE